MKTFFNSLNPSDIIQLFGIIASLITSIVAITISLVTLRQNSKMIEDASRPIISIYGESINPGSPVFYIVIKNFGSSSAYITQFDYDFDFTSAYLADKGKDYIERFNKFCNCSWSISYLCFKVLSIRSTNYLQTFLFIWCQNLP